MSGKSSRSNNSSTTSKLQALEGVLQQSFVHFKDVASEFELLQNESESYKTQFELQKKKCESETCSSAETLKKVIDSKNNILELVASALMRLHETKNFEILTETFKLLFKSEPSTFSETENLSPIKPTLEFRTLNETAKEDSLNEIEGTPTGRSSPIIMSKKSKSIIKVGDQKNKKKCQEDWPTPEKKTIKLSYPTPIKRKLNNTGGGRLRQSRLNIVNVKQTHIVDLTSSPEFCGGLRTVKNEVDCTQPLIKREPSENEDTIQPSPTCETTMFALNKIKMESPLKFKRPKCLSLTKKENIENFNTKMDTEMDMSLNILNPKPKSYPKENKPILPLEADISDDDATYCETALSGSLLRELLEDPTISPSKRPLGENKNVTNTPTKKDTGISSIRNTKGCENVKRKLPEQLEPMYKEPTVRKKSEKQALPGWVCEECRNFFGELYQDEPTKLAAAIERCSKHRGRSNPARPKTPPNFWNPRWNVPDDTEELNRMNNAI